MIEISNVKVSPIWNMMGFRLNRRGSLVETANFEINWIKDDKFFYLRVYDPQKHGGFLSCSQNYKQSLFHTIMMQIVHK